MHTMLTYKTEAVKASMWKGGVKDLTFTELGNALKGEDTPMVKAVG